MADILQKTLWCQITCNVWISNKIPLKCVYQDPVGYNSASVQVMAWCQAGHKPLTHLPLSTAYLDQWTGSALIQVIAYGLLIVNSPSRTNFSGIQIKIQNFHFLKMHLKMSFAKWQPLCPGRNELIEPVMTHLTDGLTIYVLNFSEGT